jgi:chemotaxis-related protein WspB
MLFLQCQIGDDRYALEASRVVEVLPLVKVQPMPHAPAAVAGVFTCRGAPVPLIDLSQLLLGRPAQRRLSTRIVLIEYPGAEATRHLLGLLAEKAIGTVVREAAEFSATGIRAQAAPYLGPVAVDAQGLLQWIELDQLLPASLRDVLFQPAVAA